ncbi:MAG TPA: hypothetical protein VNN73_23465 [Blastocatellia bacterium]|nr:hypothetical protein [Blastocatellia bacterium]
MNQAREPFNSSLLVAELASQLGLVGSLLINDRSDEINNGIKLMTVRPRQKRRDIILQTSSRRKIVCHKTSLPQGYNLSLLVHFQYVSIIQVQHHIESDECSLTKKSLMQIGERRFQA